MWVRGWKEDVSMHFQWFPSALCCREGGDSSALSLQRPAAPEHRPLRCLWEQKAMQPHPRWRSSLQTWATSSRAWTRGSSMWRGRRWTRRCSLTPKAPVSWHPCVLIPCPAWLLSISWQIGYSLKGFTKPSTDPDLEPLNTWASQIKSLVCNLVFELSLIKIALFCWN